jgi:hypothetical protein
MYGSVFRMRPKAGKEQDVIAIMEEWERERAPNVRGYKANFLYKLENGGLMGAAIFESKHDYFANAEDPEQDAWYTRLRDLLEDDPEWNDGEVVRSWGSAS